MKNISTTLTTTPGTKARKRSSLLRRIVVAAGVTVASFGGVAAIAPAAHAAQWGSVWTVASAGYDCGSQTVAVIPSVSVNGYGSVYAFAQVYDYNRGAWISATRNWVQITPYSPLVVYGITSYYAYAKVSYTRYANGVWSAVQTDYVPIAADPAFGVFCQQSFNW